MTKVTSLFVPRQPSEYGTMRLARHEFRIVTSSEIESSKALGKARVGILSSATGYRTLPRPRRARSVVKRAKNFTVCLPFHYQFCAIGRFWCNPGEVERRFRDKKLIRE